MNNQNNNAKLNIINGQIIALFLFILTLFVSIILAYNEKLNLENKTPLFKNDDVLKIAIINRIVVVTLGLYFVYTSILEKELDNDEDNLPIITSTLALLASLVGLYDLITKYNEFKQNSNLFDIPSL